MDIPSKEVQEAYDDLLRRSLVRISGNLARLIYLSSTRDYNTGTYHHDGLAVRFRPEIAAKALEAAHRQFFYKLSACSLEEVVNEVEVYLASSQQSRAELLHVWQNLEPYRVALPIDVNPAAGRLFVSNVKLALAVLRRQPQATGMHPKAS